MTAWARVNIGELGSVVTGRTPPSSEKHYFDGNIPFLTPTDIDGESRFIVPERFVSPKWNEQQKRVSLPPSTVCVVCIGATIGKVCMVATTSHSNQQINSVIVDETRFDPYFVYYRMKLLREELKLRAAGAATPILNKTAFTEISIEVPPLPLQHRIGSVLGAYDDLIETNHRRIALLEEMAQRLFEEWFVRFRYPGHEDHTIAETPDGPMPKEWQLVRLEKVASVNADTLRPPNVPDQIGYVDIASVVRGEIQRVEWQPFADAPGRARRKVRDGATIWSMVRPNRRSYALVLDPEDNLIVSTGFAVLDPRGISSTYLYHFVTTDAFVGYLVNNTTGAAYPAVTGAAFERALILLPPKELDRRFNAAVEPMMRLVNTMRRQNFGLSASRDLLLPRLVSGELSVSVAEREPETAV